MAFEEITPYFGFIVATFALSCLSTVCWLRQRVIVQRLQGRLITIEQRPLQQIQILAQDTGYGQAYTPIPTAPTAPPAYYLPPPPQYGTNVI